MVPINPQTIKQGYEITKFVHSLFNQEQTAMRFSTKYDSNEGMYIFELLHTGGKWSIIRRLTPKEVMFGDIHKITGTLHEGIRWGTNRTRTALEFRQLIRGGKWLLVASIEFAGQPIRETLAEISGNQTTQSIQSGMAPDIGKVLSEAKNSPGFLMLLGAIAIGTFFILRK